MSRSFHLASGHSSHQGVAAHLLGLCITFGAFCLRGPHDFMRNGPLLGCKSIFKTALNPPDLRRCHPAHVARCLHLPCITGTASQMTSNCRKIFRWRTLSFNFRSLTQDASGPAPSLQMQLNETRQGFVPLPSSSMRGDGLRDLSQRQPTRHHAY